MDFEETRSMYVDGAFVESVSGERRDVLDPATGEVFASVPEGGAEDVDHAVGAAANAAETWGRTDPSHRADQLVEIADRIAEHSEELATLETRECGKTIRQSRTDVMVAEKSFRYYAGGADKVTGEVETFSTEEVGLTIREPMGVVGVITPWNWPPMHTADFAAPALAAGNTVVMKPAPETPLSALAIAGLADDVLPDGAFNVVPGGTEAGASLVAHPGVDKLAFTGNDETGERVLESAAANITPVLLELGGKNPALVFPDADMERAVSGVLKSAYKNNGQSCANTEVILVHRDVHDEFLDALASAVSRLTVGPGLEESTDVGPVVSARQRDAVSGFLDRATYAPVARADAPEDPDLAEGFWVAPTLYAGLDHDDELVCEEVFGPVATVLPFDDQAEAVRVANDTEYGLAASIWTTDTRRAHAVARELDVGIVGVNSPSGAKLGLPFGGFKRSGSGYKKDFTETMREFTRTKAIYQDLTDDEIAF
jgi:aldehyde dehydrogenase (NAD+)